MTKEKYQKFPIKMITERNCNKTSTNQLSFVKVVLIRGTSRKHPKQNCKKLIHFSQDAAKPFTWTSELIAKQLVLAQHREARRFCRHRASQRVLVQLQRPDIGQLETTKQR